MSTAYFKARSHILSLLGDELIGNDNLAVFELVKNSYDADAEKVSVVLQDLNSDSQSILIEDDGNGMAKKVLENTWLEIGTDFKRGAKRKPSPVFGRVSLGEKGVGRLAVHKLGRQIRLESQAKGESVSHILTINWPKAISEANYIQEVSVDISRNENPSFPKSQGTRIEISELKKGKWRERDVKDLARKINSIKSPFTNIECFSVTVSANDEHQRWIDAIKDVPQILKNNLYYFDFSLFRKKDDDFVKFKWNYTFNPPKSFGIPPRKLSNKEDSEDKTLLITGEKELFKEGQKHLKRGDLKDIGPIRGRFYVYNLLGPVLNAFGQASTIKTFVKENSGVRIFRDGMRVYNYGEPTDDWLELDLTRVNKLGEHFSKNTVIGAVELKLDKSEKGLKEKTNREGFDENHTYRKFKAISKRVFEFFEQKALEDREKVKEYLEGLKDIKKVGFAETMEELREKVRSTKLEKQFNPLLKRVEKDYTDMRNVMLSSGMSGLNLGIVFHEVDREMRFINVDIEDSSKIDGVKNRIRNLIELLENFAPLLKQNKTITLNASQLVQKALDIHKPRFGFHEVIFSSPILSGDGEDFRIKGQGNLFISALSNVLDNSIYWVSSQQEIKGDDFKSAIYVNTDLDNFEGPAIVIADNGPGFQMDPQDLVLPFRTTRPGGMGLGLYFVNLVMEMIGGNLVFPEASQVALPEPYNGAVLALVFPNQ